MKTEHVPAPWGWRSASYWMTLSIALAILLIGLRFMLAPQLSMDDFGIGPLTDSALTYGRIKGIRDIFSGLALLALGLTRMKKATAYVFTAAIIIPFTDCLLIYQQNGVDLPRLLVHGGTAVYMVIASFLLFRNSYKPTT
ncbi:DUF4267 domain-containing protein [Spirosoma sp. KCTC 42546]|uniref:DUF4267 domain-containing protein n=1 Tax=Spirosoma sp. KCTC 42546 TaxID=2520506 RepID=UPI001158CFF7|nr:DUF4267 domain-containing protein [Spirosoma sp. KCTC 42546]QDK81869.1 DUF4267 domain-containing protein [Spirosoma sp. KCTC 42546]